MPSPSTSPAAPAPPEAALRALMARVQATADEAAFAAIFDACAPAIRRYFAGRLTVRDGEADDLTAEVFARAFARRTQFDPARGELLQWLYGIARHALLDHARRPVAAALPDAAPIRDSGARIDLGVGLSREHLRAGLQHLTPEQRRVVELRFLEDRDVPAVAAELGKPEVAVRQLQVRALRALRRALDCESACWREGLA